VDASGNVYVADTNNHTVREVTAAGSVTTLAGQAGVAGSADGSGTAAQFNGPSGIAVDGSGVVYVADTLNHTIRQITPAGAVTTIAGTAGVSGAVDATGSAARFYGPQGLVLDGAGNLFIADTNNDTIRQLATAGGGVTTVAGQGGIAGSADGLISQATFHYPASVGRDGAGNLYVVDTDNHAVRKIATSGVVSTLAGLAGTAGSADGVGTAAQFAFPTGIAVDAAGDAYVADTNNDTIRLCAYPSAPMITTQPQSQSVGVGTNVSFSVAATGMPPPAYQWYFNGAAIAGANGVNFTLSNAQIANAGSYTVTVTNLAGSATSSTATIAVAAPTTTVPPSGGSGGGGGGGAVEPWFLAVLAVLALLRRLVPLRKNPA
jgi:sugar lactone lactonase YvrE